MIGSPSAARPFADTCPTPASSSSPSSSSSPACPVALSAQHLHELALEAFRIGNRGRLSLCEALRVLSETRLYFDLGFPTVAAYADACFQLRRAETFEHVRVAHVLVELTELRQAFAEGRIGWSALKAVTAVASVATQGAWIDFARQSGIERTLAEVHDAARAGRDAPRGRAFGLPNLDQKLVLRFQQRLRALVPAAVRELPDAPVPPAIQCLRARLRLLAARVP